MKRLYYSNVAINGVDIVKMLQDAKNYLPEEMILLNETEWETPLITAEFVSELKKLNIRFRILHGSFNCKYYAELTKSLGMHDSDIEFWNTHWLNWTEIQLHSAHKTYQPEPDKFKYPFISLNNRSQLHRCVFIDQLARLQLIDKGAVSWLRHGNENAEYPYQYFDNKIRILDPGYTVQLTPVTLFPSEFHESLFHVVSETTSVIVNVPMISEKTAIPLFYKKPFVVLGASNHHKNLVDLGFKLYDEIIDYSFDEVENLNQRVNMLAYQLTKLVDTNYSKLYNILKPKIEYNYNRAIEIVQSLEYIPDIIKERHREFILNGEVVFTDGRFDEMIR
jgi:hypothetical protein